MKKSSIIWITTGVLLVIIGVTALLSLPILILKIINSKLVLRPSNPSYALWKDLPVPIYQSFYFFNVTNAREVQNSGKRPQLKEIGPFVYRIDIKKNQLNFTSDGESVYFVEDMTFYFDRQLSVEDQTFKITTLNSPLAIAMTLTERLSLPMRALVEIIIEYLAEDFFIERSVQELLFDGYADKLTQMAHMLNPKIPYQPKFGWMYAKNQSDDGLFSVNTGKTDISKLNSIETLNGLSHLTFWSTSDCNSLNGAKNGELFNPIREKDRTLLLYRTNFCRVLPLVWNRGLKSQYGDLSVYRYYPDANTFSNFTEYPQNSCYTPNATQINYSFESIIKYLKQMIENNSELKTKFEQKLKDSFEQQNSSNTEDNESIRQFPSGIFDLSACYFGAPAFLSYPHFLDADPYYLNTLSGLTPNATTHQTFLDIEPMTGTPIEIHLRYQINVFVNPPTALIRYRKMPKMIFPVFWQDFGIHVTQQIAEDLHWSLTGPSMIATIISSLFVTIGVLTLLVIVLLPLLRKCGKKIVSNSVETDTSALLSDNNLNNDNTDSHQ